MFPILHIGPLSIQTPGLILIIGLWISLSISETLHQKMKIPFDPYQQIVFWSLIVGIGFARLFYILTYPKYFLQSPLNILSLNPGLLDPWGALIGITLVLFWIIRKFKLSPASAFDSLAVTISIFIPFIILADWAAGGQIGLPTQLPWGINFQGNARHPIQLYQILIFSIITSFTVKWFMNRNETKAGLLTLRVIFLCSTAQLVISGFILNQSTISNGVRLSQLFYFIIGLTSLYFLLYYPSKKLETNG